MLQAEVDVDAVLSRDGGQVHAYTRQVDVLVRTERAPIEHPALEAMLGDLQDLEVDQTVIDRHPLADSQIVDEILIVDVNAALFCIVGENAEVEHVAGLEVETLGQLAGANFRAL